MQSYLLLDMFSDSLFFFFYTSDLGKMSLVLDQDSLVFSNLCVKQEFLIVVWTFIYIFELLLNASIISDSFY